MQRTHRNYRAKKIKSFLFFLLLAIFLWLLTKFSENQTISLETKITYKNTPDSLQLATDNPQKLIFDATTNGFEFLMLQLKNPVLTIDVNNYITKNDTVINLAEGELKRIIASQIGNNLSVKNLSNANFTINLNKLVVKEVPVKIVSNINYEKGFKNSGALKASPSKVNVIGAKRMLQSIDTVTTEPILLDNVKSSFSEEVALNTPNKLLTIKPQTITVSATVEEFTSHSFEVPVAITNLPEDKELTLMPEKVTVSFLVSVAKFNSVSAADFKVICDYTSAEAANGYLIPKLVKKPAYIKDVELSDKKINFLIFK